MVLYFLEPFRECFSTFVSVSFCQISHSFLENISRILRSHNLQLVAHHKYAAYELVVNLHVYHEFSILSVLVLPPRNIYTLGWMYRLCVRNMEYIVGVCPHIYVLCFVPILMRHADKVFKKLLIKMLGRRNILFIRHYLRRVYDAVYGKVETILWSLAFRMTHQMPPPIILF